MPARCRVLLRPAFVNHHPPSGRLSVRPLPLSHPSSSEPPVARTPGGTHWFTKLDFSCEIILACGQLPLWGDFLSEKFVHVSSGIVSHNKGIVNHDRKVRATGAWGSCSQCCCIRKVETNECLYPAHFSFLGSPGYCTQSGWWGLPNSV